MQIREASEADLDDVLAVESLAFGHDKEAGLVRDLLDDDTAKPRLSLLAFDGDRAVGHILFTAARLAETESTTRVALLAPLAVVPDAQKQGVGGKLVERGLQLLRQAGVELVFVLGHPDYYPRHGFQPAGRLGLDAPYPIPDEHAGAWMVQALRPNLIGPDVIDAVSGKVVCADALQKPEHWRE